MALKNDTDKSGSFGRTIPNEEFKSIELSEAELLTHQQIVDQLNQEYAKSITPEYIRRQHALQTELAGTCVEFSLKATE